MRSQHGYYDEFDDSDVDFDMLDFDGNAKMRRLRREKHRRPIRRHLGPGSKEHWDDEDFDNYAEYSDYTDGDWSEYGH